MNPKLRLLAFSAIATISAFGASKEGLRKSDRVQFQRVGPVRMGMSVKELKKAIGVPIIVEFDSEDCGFAQPSDNSIALAFMIIKDKVVRTDVSEPGFRTEKGVRVGDSESTILRLYKGQVKVTPHTYVDTGHYLTIKSKDGRYALVFETDAGVVTSFRIGSLPAAEYIEGCS